MNQFQAGSDGARLPNRLLESQAEASPDGILMVSETGAIVSCNRRFLEIWELPEQVACSGRDEIALAAISDKLADPAGFFERVAYLYNHPEVAGKEDILLRDGRVIERYSNSVTGEDGAYYGRIWFFRDVTDARRLRSERTRLLEALERERALLRSVLSSMGEGLVLLDADLRLQYLNRGAAALLGSDQADLIGLTARDLFERLRDALVDPQGTWTRFQEALGRIDAYPVVDYAMAGPPRRELRVQLFPVSSGGVAEPLIGASLQDVTQPRQVALAEERERIAMDFHDGVLQSLYAVGLALGAEERLLGPEAERTRAALGRARSQVDAIIQDVRSFIHDLGPVAAGALPALLAGLLDEVQASSGIATTLDVDSGLTAAIPAKTAGGLFYIAREAVSNVMRHSGATLLRVRLVPTEDGVALTLWDNGAGFEVVRPRSGSGHGIGNMYSRARRLGGRLKIISGPGLGTQVRVTMPLPSRGGA